VLTLSSLASPPLKTAKATENSSQSNLPCAILTPHVTPLPQRGSLMTSFFDFVLDLMGDGLRFLCLTVGRPRLPENIRKLITRMALSPSSLAIFWS
jgi:hypothetical protein